MMPVPPMPVPFATIPVPPMPVPPALIMQRSEDAQLFGTASSPPSKIITFNSTSIRLGFICILCFAEIVYAEISPVDGIGLSAIPFLQFGGMFVDAV